jgi:ferrous iron transport protein B
MKQRNMRIALAGNPNSGKTTLFNSLTGGKQQVGNYPGITVEKREGRARFNGTVLQVADLPGTYSLTAYSAEELAARDALVRERPDVVLDVVDATNLERNLYLAVQLLELGVPMVLALNMMDEAEKNGARPDTRKLAELLGAPVVETVARSGLGREELLNEAVRTAAAGSDGEWHPLRITYGPELDPFLEEMTEKIRESGFLTRLYPARWIALKYLEGDEQIVHLGRRHGGIASEMEAAAERAADHCRQRLNIDPEGVIADRRYAHISSLLREGVLSGKEAKGKSTSDKLDTVLTHAVLGPAVMLAVLYGLFQLTFSVGDIPLGWVEAFFARLGQTVHGLLPEGVLRSLLVSGIIGGVGGVLSFVPLILIMFLGITFLEDSGYMARMAYMLDRVFRAFGLHGSSIMPFIISGGIPGGCAVPGLMATRSLRSPKEKLATLLTAPFLSCGAKVPVFLLLAGAFFSRHSAELLFAVTLLGWGIALLTALLLRSTLIRGEATPFVLELPPYRLPTLRAVLTHTWQRAWQYIKKAGTIVLALSVVIWAAMTFPGLPDADRAQFRAESRKIQAEMARADRAEHQVALREKLETLQTERARQALKHSLAGRLGTFLEPITRLAGFDWKTNIALAGGFAAKEVIVSTLGTAYSLESAGPDHADPLADKLAQDPDFTRLTGVSLMVFVLLYAPCFVSVVTLAREASWQWAAFSVAFNTGLAFALAAGIYQIGQILSLA